MISTIHQYFSIIPITTIFIKLYNSLKSEIRNIKNVFTLVERVPR
jgi:hypothetical protein